MVFWYVAHVFSELLLLLLLLLEVRTVKNACMVQYRSQALINVIYSPTNAQVIILKTVLKFTLKELRPVSVQ